MNWMLFSINIQSVARHFYFFRMNEFEEIFEQNFMVVWNVVLCIISQLNHSVGVFHAHDSSSVELYDELVGLE